MGIKITSSTMTSEGTTTTLYLNITEFYRKKDGLGSQFPVQYYMEKEGNKCKVFEGVLKSTYIVDISGSIGSVSIEKAAYDAIGAELKSAGLSPMSDETGIFVAY